MSNARIESLKKALSQNEGNPLGHYGLGCEYLKVGEWGQAASALARAVELDPNYSAAWKMYGQALVKQGEVNHAKEVYRRGIAVAVERGDKQAQKEMQVFLKRLEAEA